MGIMGERDLGLICGNSQCSSREVEVVPKVFVVLHNTAHQVQQRLAFHLSS